jgi:acetyl-CoA carboxylase beta subunit
MASPKRDYHFPLSGYDRVEFPTDEGPSPAYEAVATAGYVSRFVDKKRCAQRLAEAEKKAGVIDAVVIGKATLNGVPVSMAAADFGFKGGSAGGVAGEKGACAFPRGIARRRDAGGNLAEIPEIPMPVVSSCPSGGGGR